MLRGRRFVVEKLSDSALAVVVLAAGSGTRMKSALPKVLHAIGGRPMMAHVLAVTKTLNAARVVVVTAPDAAPGAALGQGRGGGTRVQQRQLPTRPAALAARNA